MNRLFSGSYLDTDVGFLLNILDKNTITNTDVQQKEHLIQTGQRHYSDMLTLENAPSDTHQQLFLQALSDYGHRTSRDIYAIAKALQSRFLPIVNENKPLILLSLVRAGLPVGVLLQRIFSDNDLDCQLASRHFGISIIRERGLDMVALAWVLQQFPDSPIVFVDGWTGKGAIYHELKNSLDTLCQNNPQSLHNFSHSGEHIPLVTLADPAGVAWLSASDDDWLMPASLLNSTVSGLISRTLFAKNPDEFHACIFYDNLTVYDNSLFFIYKILSFVPQQLANYQPLAFADLPVFRTKNLIEKLAKEYHINNPNRIKPTIAEATRAVLRREPECVLLQRDDSPDTALLRHLCSQKNVAIRVVGDTIAPYQAITIIKQRQSS